MREVIAWLGRRISRSKAMPSHPEANAVVQALAVMKEGPDRAELEAVFQDAGWRLDFAASLGAAITSMERNPLPILLYDRELSGTDWRTAVSDLSRLSPRPCVVLLTRSADHNLWEEVVRCGGFDLLRVPVDRMVVLRTIRAGWAIWRRRNAPSERHEITPFRTA